MIYLSGGIIGTFHHLYFSGTWISAYKWPVYFFVAVAFWNFVGAGLFGFVINLIRPSLCTTFRDSI